MGLCTLYVPPNLLLSDKWGALESRQLETTHSLRIQPEQPSAPHWYPGWLRPTSTSDSSVIDSPWRRRSKVLPLGYFNPSAGDTLCVEITSEMMQRLFFLRLLKFWLVGLIVTTLALNISPLFFHPSPDAGRKHWASQAAAGLRAGLPENSANLRTLNHTLRDRTINIWNVFSLKFW